MPTPVSPEVAVLDERDASAEQLPDFIYVFQRLRPLSQPTELLFPLHIDVMNQIKKETYTKERV